MKSIFKISVVVFLCLTACAEGNKDQQKIQDKEPAEVIIQYESYGNEFNPDGAVDRQVMSDKFHQLKTGDTISVKFASSIDEVCSKKGCWMKLELPEGKQTMVTFKDYEFFVPLDAKNKEVIVDGKAFLKETSVKELQHYAKDAGKTDKEIAEIKEPKVEFAFVAEGVLMKKS